MEHYIVTWRVEVESQRSKTKVIAPSYVTDFKWLYLIDWKTTEAFTMIFRARVERVLGHILPENGMAIQ